MYPYNFLEQFFTDDMMEVLGEAGFVFLGFLLGFLVVALIVALVFYIFQSLGLYTIAKRRGLQHAWLAWIPVGNYWIAGSIADQYQYVAKGKIKNKRKILLILSLASFAVAMVLQIVSTVLMLTATDATVAMSINATFLVIKNLCNMAIGLATLVFWHMALYDLYCSCNPDNSVLFLVLGIIFGCTIPFFIFFNRKKDGGMPPRRPAPQAYIHQEPVHEQPVYEQPQQNWNEPEQL